MASLSDRIKNAWNIFWSSEEMKTNPYGSLGPVYNYRPDRIRLRGGSEKTIATSIYNRIAIDVASIGIQHARLDQNGRYLTQIPSSLNNCLTLEANIDQTSGAFIRDAVMSLLDEGCVAVVPVDISVNPKLSSSFDILTMRTGKVIDWYPEHVRINIYNDKKGRREDITVLKRKIAIVDNPLYEVMNQPNSVMQRLLSKLSLLDAVDEQSSSGKLDLIVQLPYVIKTEARKQQAELRKKDIVDQLSGSKYGIAYVDATEKITQLNRPAENNLMAQIEYLTSMLYSQLGITTTVMDGTADEKTMLNYYNRTVEPILASLVDSMKRNFLSQTARTQGQSIIYIRDPFKLVPVNQIADIADKFTRNEILTSNEVRGIVGMKPSEEKSADELRNKNLNPAQPQESSKQEIPVAKVKPTKEQL